MIPSVQDAPIWCLHLSIGDFRLFRDNPTAFADFDDGTCDAFLLRTGGAEVETSRAQAESRCRLLRPIRDHEGRTHFAEQPRIVRQVENLDRRMFLVQFEDGSRTFVFPHEVALCDSTGSGQ